MTRNSRRNRTKRLFLGVFFLILGGALFPIETRISVSGGREGAAVSLALEYAPVDLILESLRQGTRSEIQYQIRIYKTGKGLAGIITDTLLEEYYITQEAKMEEYTRFFLVLCPEETKAFTKPEDFIEAFLTLSGFPLPPESLEKGVYILARTRLSTIKLVPPLKILNLFLPETRIVTPWVRYQLPEEYWSR